MLMQYQGINVILNTAELICMTVLGIVFLYNRINISRQYAELIIRLDRLILAVLENTRGKAKNKKN